MGLLAATDERVLTGEPVIVTFRLPESDRWFDAMGTVARVVHGRRTTGVISVGADISDTWVIRVTGVASRVIACVVSACGLVEQGGQLSVELVGQDVDGVGLLRARSKGERVVEVGSGRQQVGVGPHSVARGRTLGGSKRSPERGGVAQPAWPQLESDQRGERLLGRTAG